MDFLTETASLHGLMALFMRENLQIIALQVEALIDGLMAVHMRDRSKMACAMGMVNTVLTMQHTKENGCKVRSMVKER